MPGGTSFTVCRQSVTVTVCVPVTALSGKNSAITTLEFVPLGGAAYILYIWRAADPDCETLDRQIVSTLTADSQRDSPRQTVSLARAPFFLIIIVVHRPLALVPTCTTLSKLCSLLGELMPASRLTHTYARVRAMKCLRLSVPTQAYVPQVGPFSSGGTVKSVYGSSWQASTHASSAMSVRASVRNCW